MLGKVVRLALIAAVAALLGGCTTTTPSVAPLEEGFSTAEYAEGMVACLADLDWNVHVDPEEQSVDAEFPETEGERFLVDYRACEVALGADQPPTLSDDEKRSLYDAYMNTLQCLKGIGIAVPDGVSWETFRSAPLGTYYAYKEYPPARYPDFQRAELACPQP